MKINEIEYFNGKNQAVCNMEVNIRKIFNLRQFEQHLRT